MKKTIKKTVMGIFLLGAIVLVSSCQDELDVQQMYPFTITTMPVQSRIKVGETAEIRLQLHREGYYKETRYFIRYFQPDGKGTLTMSDGTVFVPNDLYILPSETFRLYYTSASTDQQKIDVYIEDSFNQIEKLSFSFQNEREDVEENEDDDNELDEEIDDGSRRNKI
jgi:hypothetical protein